MSDLSQILDALDEQNFRLGPNDRRLRRGQGVLPKLMADLRLVLFPNHFGPPTLRREDRQALLHRALAALTSSVSDALWDAADQKDDVPRQAHAVVGQFAGRLPQVREWLGQDIRAAVQGDPASVNSDEVLLCYPGFEAITVHRIAHELYRLKVPILPRILAEIAHGNTGIDIHPGAQIGGSFFIDHGTGVVIGETCIIGERVRLYQGVTLGAKRFPRDGAGNLVKGLPRHPIVGNDVVIYAGATILGRITIGSGSSIGGNVWVTEDVAPGSRVTQARPMEEVFDGGMGI